MGTLATSPLLSRGSPLLRSGGQNQEDSTCAQGGYLTPAVSRIPTASERGENQKLPTRGQSGYVTPADLHRFRAVAKNQKWPACGQSGYVTPAISGIPTTSEGGGNTEVAQLWAKWLCHPCCLGEPGRFRAGGRIRRGSLVGKTATSPLLSPGSPPLQSG